MNPNKSTFFFVGKPSTLYITSVDPKKSWYKNHSISPMVGFLLNFTPDGRGIDPDIFFDDDGKVWYVGTAAPGKPNFPGEGVRFSMGKKVAVKRCFRKIPASGTTTNKNGLAKKRQVTTIAEISNFCLLFFFVWIPFFFWIPFFWGSPNVRNDDSTKSVPRGDLLPCWGPQGWCLCWADLLCLQQSVLQIIRTKPELLLRPYDAI